jgi:hypothetical protein
LFKEQVLGNDEKRTDRPDFKKGRTINRDLGGFAFFLFISFVFWYLNFLGKDTEASVGYPLRYSKIPANRTLITQGASRLNLSIKGTGYSVIKLRVKGTTDPLEIDLSRVSYKRVTGSREMNYYVLTSGVFRSFASQLRTDCEIISVKPDTLFFTLRKKEAGGDQLKAVNDFSIWKRMETGHKF